MIFTPKTILLAVIGIIIYVTIPFMIFVPIILFFIDWLSSLKQQRPKQTSVVNPFIGKEQLIAFRHLKTQYLHSVDWKHKRSLVLARDNYKCVYCHRTTSLHVHHIRYTNLGKEPLEDLITVCEHCHSRIHDTVGYPNSYSDYMTKEYILDRSSSAKTNKLPPLKI